MFEKEAEEWVISNTEIYDDKFGIECETEPQAKEAYIAGAEFGYNKAIVEIKDAYEGNGNFSAWFENYLEGKNV